MVIVETSTKIKAKQYMAQAKYMCVDIYTPITIRLRIANKNTMQKLATNNKACDLSGSSVNLYNASVVTS